MVEDLAFKIYLALAGGALIGVSSSLNYILFGKITGLSGYLFKVFSLQIDDIYIMKFCFLVSMVSVVEIFYIFNGHYLFNQQLLDPESDFNPILLTTGALLVGIGVRWGGGCTSGHGVCGLPRLSKRSLIAVPIFMLTGILTSTLLSLLPPIPPQINLESSFKTDYYNYFTFFLISLLQVFAIIGILESLVRKDNCYHKTLPLMYSLTGALFGAGLLVAGMCSRDKILAFLTVDSDWDPSLAFVMAAAVGINFITFQIVMKQGKAVFEQEIDLPDTHIDKGIFIGPALFGVGWGITGLCPGPALANIGVLFIGIPVVVLIFAGQSLYDFMETKVSGRNEKDKEEPLINPN